jgi:hypothetical protein
LNRALRALGTIAAATAAAISISGPVAAHSGEWGVFLDAPKSSPGSSLHLRGDLPSTGPIQIVLVGAESSGVLLTTVDDAPNGHFETFITFPDGLVPGVWAVEARAAGMQPVRASVELLPVPPPGPQDEATAATGMTASPLPASPLAPLPNPASKPPDLDLVPFAVAGLAVAGLAVLLLRTRRSTATR